ncbi:MAG TPA: hypothetical protein VFZ85_07950 [Jiangellaceae bacterium]
MPYRRSLGLVAVSLIMLAACSGDGGPETGSDDSPLAEYMGPDAVSFEGGGMSISYGGAAETEEHVPTEEDLQKQREFENLVQQCMRDEGFEYVPYVVDPSDWDNPFEDAYALPPDEFAEQYGYGISTLHMAESDLPEDPNEEIRRGLSPQALAEYERALYGDMEGQEFSDGEEWTPPPLEDRGCYDKASAQVWGDPYEDEGNFRDPHQEFESLMESLWSIQERFMSDPRMEEPTQNWRDCMAEAGHPFEMLGEPEQEVWRRMDELQGWDEFMELEEQAAAEGVLPAAAQFEPKEIDPAELEELQEYELAVAVADVRCKKEHYNEIAEQVQYEVEEQFVEEHREELERYRDWMAENQQ